ncbi:hypothetical protein ACFVTY_12460 [Streptomyces sp. NPDC058067]|uniref:hypothetical protein n=1 Tax=Streptomyces sp. NPDC058067 TaxID=3346324 RepID=UPI0036ED7109
MGTHSVDEVYQEVVDIKKKLEKKGGGGGASEEYIDKKFKEAKGKDPSQGENWGKAIGFELDGLIKGFQDFTNTSIAAWSTLGAVVSGFVIKSLIDSDKVKVALLDKAGFKHSENGIPRSKKKLEARAAAAAAARPRVPVTSIDTEQMKSMRKASIDLARSLSDLTKDVSNAARAIA